MAWIRWISSKIHLWVGLALSALIIVLSVTGSVLVFRDTLDRWLRPDLMQVTPHPSQRSLDEAVRAARAEHPDITPSTIELPTRPDAPVVIWLESGEGHVYVDPYRGTVLGRRSAHEGWMNTFHQLHVYLFSGTMGLTVVGGSGLLLVLLSFTGLVLWWPRHLRALKAALKIVWRSGWKRLNYDLHRAGGFYTLGFVLLVSLTGAGLVFYGSAQSLLNTATGSSPWPPPPPTEDTTRTAPPLQTALDAAQQALPEAEASFVYVTASPAGFTTVRMRTPPEWHPHGRSFVYVGAGETIARVDDARTAPLGARLTHLLYPLHIGAFGRIGQWLYVLLGLSPTVLSITGTLIWYRRWRRADAATSAGDLSTVGVRPVRIDRFSEDKRTQLASEKKKDR